MSYYVEKNGLANLWSRQSTKLEWAQWVYYHPDETEKLLEKLLQAEEYNSNFEGILNQIANIEDTNSNQTEQINSLSSLISFINSHMNTLETRVSENEMLDAQQQQIIDSTNTSLKEEDLQQLFEKNPTPDDGEDFFDPLTNDELSTLFDN